MTAVFNLTSIGAIVLSFLSLGLAAGAAQKAQNLMTLSQDAAGNAHLFNVALDRKDTASAQSSVTFGFRWPLVEVTPDCKNEQYYLIAYPNDLPGPALYLLDKDLSPSYVWNTTTFSYFDLQYSSKQETLFGIYVSSTYGRVLSNFVANRDTNEVTYRELYTLPYMWYVNASSFDIERETYFALINNFPGKTNSTLDQQLVVGDFSDLSKPVATTTMIQGDSIFVRFIGFSNKLSTLFGTGIDKAKENTFYLFVLNTQTADVESVVLTLSGITNVGPLVVDDVQQRVLYYLQSGSNKKWTLYELPFRSILADKERVTPVAIQDFEGSDYAIMSAAAGFFHQ